MRECVAVVAVTCSRLFHGSRSTFGVIQLGARTVEELFDVAQRTDRQGCVAQGVARVCLCLCCDFAASEG